MRQRHRQWLAAMALSLPVFSDSFRVGMTPNAQRPLIERQHQRIEVVPNMFLSSKSPFTISVDTDSRFGGRAAGQERDDDDEAPTRTLGFDTRLHLLDSSEWNEGTAIDTSTIEDQVPSSLFKKSSLAWLPWIPTLSQIQGLKLVELKQACAERGLKKVRFLLNSCYCCRHRMCPVSRVFHSFLVWTQGRGSRATVGMVAETTRGVTPRTGSNRNGHGTWS